jgi:hypothetical protein
MMNPSDGNELDDMILGRAAQHDCELCETETPEGQVLYSWRWQGTEPGPQFLSRDLAMAWMAEWLDDDTASQGLSRAEFLRRNETAD